ncbi:MAG: DMT family transporter [Marinibacterium sp.]|nr:DMT family transporter [Marinibacterium sp.]
MLRTTLLMLAAMSLIPAGDLAAKLLTGQGTATPAFVAWSRFALGALMVWPFVPKGALALLRDWRIWFRALLIAGGISSIQVALKHAPIADVFAAFFVGPIVSFVLSALFLGEKVTAARAALLGLGFAGVLLVVRPGLGGDPALLWAVLAGVFYGAYLTASRWLADLGHPRQLILTQLVVGAIVLAPAGLRDLPQPDLATGTLVLASAGLSMLGNLLLVMAYGRAPAARLAPLVYVQLVAATGLGWLAFGDLPDPLAWGGLALVAGAGLASALLRR